METRIWFTNDAGYINIEVKHSEGDRYVDICTEAAKALAESKFFKSYTLFDFKKDSPTQTTFHAEF